MVWLPTMQVSKHCGRQPQRGVLAKFAVGFSTVALVISELEPLKALEPAKWVLALEQERAEARTTLLLAETHVQKEASLGSNYEPNSISILATPSMAPQQILAIPSNS